MKAKHCELFYVAMGVYAVVAICILAVPAATVREAQTVMDAETAALQNVRNSADQHSAAISGGPEPTKGAAIQISTADVLK